LINKERRLIMALILLAAAVAVTVIATATFTSSTATAGNMIARGALSVDKSKNGAATLTAAGLGPGRSTSGTVTISNTGSSGGTFTLSAVNIEITPVEDSPAFSKGLLLVIDDVTSAANPTVLFSGRPNAVGMVALGRWSAGTTHDYKFTLTFPRSLAVAGYEHTRTQIIFMWSVT
jgi:hypothetical protein